MKLSRVLISLSLGLLSAFGWSQTSAPSESFDTRPGATVVIKEDKGGSELVNITYANPKFPSSLATSQIQGLGQELGSGPRGLQMFQQAFGQGPDEKWLKAQFATDGLIDRQAGTLNLQALTRAFAGAPSPFTINAIKLIFDGETPTAATIRTFANDSVGVDGEFVQSPPSLEYTILLRTQDPTAITIPVRHNPAPPPAPAPAPAIGPPMNLLIGLVVLASVAAGALVYFLLSGSGARRPRSR